MSTTREQFETDSARLNSCPLCGHKDVQLNTYSEIKPDANCNNCGISYQEQTVDEVVQGWNISLPGLAVKKNAKVRDALEGWLAWYEGPAAQGIGYIDPPLKRTREALEEGKPSSE